MFEEKKIKITSLNIPHLGFQNLLCFRKKLSEFFEIHRGEYDVLHTHCVEEPFVVKLAKKSGVRKIVTHVHSYRNKQKTIQNLIKSIAVFCNSSLANVCLACSEEVGVATYPRSCVKKFKEMINGIDAKLFDFNPLKREEYRKILNIENSFVVCNVARMEPVKNQKFLLEIFKSILNYKSNAVLLLVGEGSLKIFLEEKARSLGIAEKVMFLGEKSDVSDVLQASDVFILPSFNEGLGIAAIEAQAAGLRTYVSKNVVPKRVDCTGLVSFIELNKSPEDWARIVLQQNKGYFRKSQYEKVCAARFDNCSLSRELTRIYKKEINV